MTGEHGLRTQAAAREWAERAAALFARARSEGAGEAEREALRDHVFRFGLDYFEECAWPLNEGPPFLRLAVRRALDGKRRPVGDSTIHAEWSPDGEAWAPIRGEAAGIVIGTAREVFAVADPFEET